MLALMLLFYLLTFRHFTKDCRTSDVFRNWFTHRNLYIFLLATILYINWYVKRLKKSNKGSILGDNWFPSNALSSEKETEKRSSLTIRHKLILLVSALSLIAFLIGAVYIDGRRNDRYFYFHSNYSRNNRWHESKRYRFYFSSGLPKSHIWCFNR